jgi:hypothetical protein
MADKGPSKTEPTKQMPKFPPSEQGNNEGEGNRTADRRYRENVSRHVQSGKSEPAAEDARRALDSDEADDLREAERHGKAADKRPRMAGERERDDLEEDELDDERLEDQQAREDQGHRTPRQ